MEGRRENLLKTIAYRMKELADGVTSPTPRVEIHLLVQGCRLAANFIGYLGLLFKFGEMEFLSKVNDLDKQATADDTLETMPDREVEKKCAKKRHSGSRSLIRVKRAMVMLRVLFEEMLSSRESSLEAACSKSYEQSFAAYHGWANRTAVSAALSSLPTRAKLMKLYENEVSMTTKMKTFVDSSVLVEQYIDSLFHSRESLKELVDLI